MAVSGAEPPSPQDDRDDGDDPLAPEPRKRRGLLWPRRSRRVREAREAEEAEDIAPLLEGIAEDVDLALATRRRRLQAKLGTSLRTFRAEVLDEVELQANEYKDRQEKLKMRQADIAQSLAALRQDLLDEVEESLRGVQRGGQKLEKALTDMRTAWEAEVNDLVNEAKADVDLAVRDIDEAITQQRDEWRHAVAKFEALRLTQGVRPRFNTTSLPFITKGGAAADLSNASSSSSSSASATSSLVAPLRDAAAKPGLEMEARVAELQASIDLISNELESDLKLFKQRWEVTTDKLESLPSELPKLKSLASARAYVAETIFAGDVPALLNERSRVYQDVAPPLRG